MAKKTSGTPSVKVSNSDLASIVSNVLARLDTQNKRITILEKGLSECHTAEPPFVGVEIDEEEMAQILKDHLLEWGLPLTDGFTRKVAEYAAPVIATRMSKEVERCNDMVKEVQKNGTAMSDKMTDIETRLCAVEKKVMAFGKALKDFECGQAEGHLTDKISAGSKTQSAHEVQSAGKPTSVADGKAETGNSSKAVAKPMPKDRTGFEDRLAKTIGLGFIYAVKSEWLFLTEMLKCLWWLGVGAWQKALYIFGFDNDDYGRRKRSRRSTGLMTKIIFWCVFVPTVAVLIVCMLTANDATK